MAIVICAESVPLCMRVTTASPLMVHFSFDMILMVSYLCSVFDAVQNVVDSDMSDDVEHHRMSVLILS
uniref:Uncharacterized protein n=1 Tax=Onchocerca volvulus TaxID=6282 RepID=A0A8R1XWN3_ONCVO